MKTSIIIATYNKLDYTKLCIESIRSYTDAESYEIVVVDNRSTDGSVEWLQQQSDIQLILNEENLGFPKACNQGIEVSAGENILLLNNDVVVTANWLNNLVRALYSADEIGAIGCVTNNSSYFQAIPVPYESLEDMQVFARGFNQSDENKWEERLKLIGFCMLIKKSVVDQVGLVDEIFTPGNFEDDDYSFRIRKAGYRLLLCRDTFIHHFGSTSWKDNVEGFNNLLHTNQAKFKDKWDFAPESAFTIRFDVVDAIEKSENAEIRVLEIGCHGGGTLLNVRNRFKKAELFGIEQNLAEAECAAIFADVAVGDPLETIAMFPKQSFDVIVLPSDFYDYSHPVMLLQTLLEMLTHDGQIVGTFPNQQHYLNVRNFMQGNIAKDFRQHIKYSELKPMFYEAGLDDIQLTGQVAPISDKDEAFIQQLVTVSGNNNLNSYKINQFVAMARHPNTIPFAVEELIAQREGDRHIYTLSRFSPERVIEVIQRLPEDIQVSVLNILGVYQLEQKNQEEVLPYLNLAFELNNSNPMTLFHLGFAMYSFGQNELALEWWELIPEKDEKVLRWMEDLRKQDEQSHLIYLLRGIENNEDRLDRMEELLSGLQKWSIEAHVIGEVIERDITDKAGVLNLIAVHGYERDNKADFVLSLLQKSLQIDPKNADTLYNIAFVLHHQGALESAVNYLEQIKIPNRAVRSLISLIREEQKVTGVTIQVDKGIIDESIDELLLCIDHNENDLASANEAMARISEDEALLFRVLSIIDSSHINNKVQVCNTLAVVGFENGFYDGMIPLLQKALGYSPVDTETLYNLSVILAEFGEVELALSYALAIKEKDRQYIDWVTKLQKLTTSSEHEEDILSVEQNDVQFTGERIVINQEVKQRYSNVLEEHLNRYKLACQFAKGNIVLDAACGAGYGSKMLQQAGASFVVGVDISEESLQSARNTYGDDQIKFVYGDVNHLQLEDESFDMVVSFETIEHIDSGANWITESARLLKEDGIFLVSTPNRSVTNPGTYFIEQPLNTHHKYEYTVTEFIGELLKEYDVLELYGQTFINDNESYFATVMRQVLNKDLEFVPGEGYKSFGHQLLPLGNVKDAQPMYVVAVCRKKPKTVNGLGRNSRTDFATDSHIDELPKYNGFYHFGSNSFLGQGAEIVGAQAISIGDNVFIKNNSWLNIASTNFDGRPRIIIDNGCEIGKNFSVSVANRAIIEKQVIIGPNVYIADCGHAYENVGLPIMLQGVTSITNEVIIGEGSWLGINSVIVGNIRVGKGCVIAANSFVNKNVPAYSVAAGNPAKIIKMFDTESVGWVKVKNQKEIETILKKRTEVPLISICIPTYNRARDLERCLESIYSQINDDPLFEILISNNNSSDQTEEVVAQYREKYQNITYWKNDENIGADRNVMLTMQKAKGKYLIMHGDDDFFNPGLTRKIIYSIMTYRECGIFFLNVLNDNKEIKMHRGMDKFLEETSIASGFISSIILSREELNKLEEPYKFVQSAFNQIYIQYSILENNPNFCLINDSSFTYAGNQPLGYNFGEVFIKHYLDILEYFKTRGLSEELIQEDKKKILYTTILPWYKRIHEHKLDTDLTNFDYYFDEYYANEPYYELVKSTIAEIHEHNGKIRADEGAGKL